MDYDVEAMQYDGYNWAEICLWIDPRNTGIVRGVYSDIGIVFRRRDGSLTTTGVGDWITKDESGEFYVIGVKNGIIKTT